MEPTLPSAYHGFCQEASSSGGVLEGQRSVVLFGLQVFLHVESKSKLKPRSRLAEGRALYMCAFLVRPHARATSSHAQGVQT